MTVLDLVKEWFSTKNWDENCFISTKTHKRLRKNSYIVDVYKKQNGFHIWFGMKMRNADHWVGNKHFDIANPECFEEVNLWLRERGCS